MNENDEFSLPPDYEWLRDRINRLDLAGESEEREVDWLDTDRVLGAARSSDGSVELFLAGPEFPVTDLSVRRAAKHAHWSAGDGSDFDATQIALPAASHFDQVAAFICAELLKNGILDNANQAFSRTEPIIALAFRRAHAGDSFLLGLAGELIFLRTLLGATATVDRSSILSMWKGSERSTRDFQIGEVGVEVKTTTSDVSEHQIHGTAQVQPGISANGTPESALYLLSLGVTWLGNGITYGESLADLVEGIAADLSPAGCDSEFRGLVASYGGGSVGKSAIEASHYFNRRFVVDFERMYDMTDTRIKLPSAADFDQFEHLVSDSLTFRVRLPERVNGDLNPIASLSEAVVEVLARA